MNRFALTLVAVSAVLSGQAQSPVGDWQGTLKAGAAELRLALHVSRNGDGTLKATLDSIDQNANGIPVTSISLAGSKLVFTVDAVHGAYTGTLSADSAAISGTWSQGPPLPLDFKRATAPLKTEHKPAPPSDIDGAWLGTIEAGAVKLRVVFHLTNTEDGLMGTTDSPDQGMQGMPIAVVTRSGASLKLEIKALGGVYEGKIDPGLMAINGTLTQNGRSLPLVLHRVTDAAQLGPPRRPQNPVKPYPYREEEVVYDNAPAGVKLAATLTIPPGKGPFPAVVLITGSGPQDRDEALLGHRPFLVLSDYLTRRGIAVLRADDRGVGKSTGNFEAATTADFSTDAEAGLAYLKTRSEADPRRIGLIGHSEGGMIAPMVAARNRDVAFIVMMAGPGVPGDELLPAQAELIAEASGKSHQEAVRQAAQLREILAILKSGDGDAATEKKLREKLAGMVPDAQIGMQIRTLTSAWYRYLVRYDPGPDLRKVMCPVLAVNGEKDLQVPPGLNLPAIRKAFAASGNQNVEVDEMPGLNHLFQTAKTGAPGEYGQIEETMSPVVLEKIATWISKR